VETLCASIPAVEGIEGNACNPQVPLAAVQPTSCRRDSRRADHMCSESRVSAAPWWASKVPLQQTGASAS
jgi:hypothetical protein